MIPEEVKRKAEHEAAQQPLSAWLLLAILLLILALAAGLGYTAHQRRSARELARRNAQLQAALNRTRARLAKLSARMDELSKPLPPDPAAPAEEPWDAAPPHQPPRRLYRFSLTKSKHFKKEGPIGISLRHTSTKHENYDLVLLVNDTQISKKSVDLYEPVLVSAVGHSPPLELVVNQIGKNRVSGYVSVPKSDFPAKMLASRDGSSAPPAPAVRLTRRAAP